MSRRKQQRPTVANPIFKKSLGDVISEAAKAGQDAPVERGAAPPGEALAAPAEDPADKASWPMPVSEFRKGQYLHSGDVVLTTKLGSLFSFFNRVLDASDFAHAALVFATPHSDIGVDESYLLETTFGGVELDAFGEIVEPTKVYEDTGRPPEYIVGIKRLAHPWATPQIRAMVSGRMLRFLDIDDYDFSMLAALAARHTHFWFKVRSILFGRAPSLGEYLRGGGKYAPAEFICSGFVQFAFVDMVREALERGLLPVDDAGQAWRDVAFAPWVNSDTTMEDLMGVRPIELAESDGLAWKYLVYGGMVHRVDSMDDVNAMLTRIRKERKARAAREA